MTTELMPCPVCGEKVIVDDGGFAMEAKGVFCEHCGYNILRDPGEIPDDWMERGVSEWLAHDHNALARRAEIGRLVEALCPHPGPHLSIDPNDGKTVAWSTGKAGEGASILEALRALAIDRGIEAQS